MNGNDVEKFDEHTIQELISERTPRNDLTVEHGQQKWMWRGCWSELRVNGLWVISQKWT